MARWPAHRVTGSAAVLHRGLPMDRRGIWLFEVDRPSVVLGSTQRTAVIDHDVARALGLEVVVRTSGGGAVLLEPGAQVWADVVIPREDPLWVDDVSTSAIWLGRVWVDAVRDIGVDGAAVHDGSMRDRELGSHVCFAGLAAGEVTVDGAKVVGVSQRRTREGARFQCVVLRRWDPDPVLAVLGGSIDDVGRTAVRASRVATIDASVLAMEEALLSRLP